MLKIGCHLSASKGFYHMAKEAVSIGANTFQFFTRNPRGGKAKTIDEKDIEKYLKFAKENNLQKVVAHAPYTLNACSADEAIRKFALETMTDDLERMEYIPGNYYNFHPGSHVKQGVDTGIKYIVEMLNKVMEKEYKTTILLETMAGKGSEIGRTFEELKTIIDSCEYGDRLGVCLDTCHIFDGCYDIKENLDGVIKEFDDVIGKDRLKAVHLNDSMNVLGSHKDRHQILGGGNIGIEAFRKIINHPVLKELPMELETPNDLEGYKKEIALVRSMYE